MTRFGWVCLSLLLTSLMLSQGCGPSAVGSGDTSAPTSTATTPDAGGPESGDPKAAVEPGVDPSVDPGAKAGQPDEKTAEAAKPPSASGADEVQEITFEDLNLRIQADLVFRPWMLKDDVKALDGKRVRIIGFMLPDADIRGVKEFVLLRNTECKFGPGGQADHLIMVTLKKGLETEYRTKPVSVEGVLKVNPYTGVDGNTWSIYDLIETENIKTVRR